MANVRDLRGGPGDPNPNENTGLSERSLMGYDDMPTKDPREEGYCEMLKLNLCPKLTMLSFCTIISFLNVVVFVVQLFIDKINKEGAFLQVQATGKLIMAFGRLEYPVKKKVELWRLLTSLFLHANFDHLFFNIVSTLIWGSLVEKLIGRTNTAIIYFLGGILGNLFSLDFIEENQLAVGASTGIFAFFGALIGILALNWYRFERNGYRISNAVITIVIILLLNGGFLASKKGVDNYAHGGGLIAGTFVAMIIGDLQEDHGKGPVTAFEKRIKICGVLLVFLMTAICSTYFFVFK